MDIKWGQALVFLLIGVFGSATIKALFSSLKAKVA